MINEILDHEKVILPEDENIVYSGRIDFTDSNAPLFIYACSSIVLRFIGSKLKIVIENHHSYWDNYLGFIIDGKQEKVKLKEQGEECILLFEALEESEHEVMIFKRMDSCHTFHFHGFIVNKEANILKADVKPSRRIEVYGDSVSAGEVSEAVDFCGEEDPVHQGEYSNSYYSYSWFTARKLGAELHDIAQGGIALLDKTGWFMAPTYRGMEHTYELLHYNKELGPDTVWDFSKYIPQVVIIAIGQNDNHPEDYMKEDYDGEKAQNWREHYRGFVLSLREKYPKALIILSTTILGHDASWDKAIEEVCQKLNDAKVKHFMYSNNGCGTKGHIRIPEADRMSDELSEYILSFGDAIWENE